MPLVIADRVKETTTTTGTGTITLAGAAAGFRSFSVVGNGNTTYYAIVDTATGAWETGIGTYSTTGPTLARTTVLASSNAGSLVSFGSGSKDVFVTYPASRSVFSDGFNASGTWAISISGNAATVSSITSGQVTTALGYTPLAPSAIGSTVQAYDADLAAIAALTPTADNFIVGNGSTWILETPSQTRTSLGGTTVGQNLFTLTNPSAITFPRINADNTVSTLDAATFRSAIGAGTSSTTGTVTSVSGTGTVSGLSLSGTVTSSGNLTLSGTLSVVPSNFASQTANTFLAAPNGITGAPTFRAIVAADIPTLNQNTTGTASNVTGTVAVANGGTGSTTQAGARTNLGLGTAATMTGPTGTIVGTTDTQTLTNKTLTSPDITQNVQLISTGTTAVRSRTYVLTASLTLTLPASPAAGDWVAFINRSGTTTASIARNGSNIMSLAEDMTLDSAQARGTLVFADATRGWTLID